MILSLALAQHSRLVHGGLEQSDFSVGEALLLHRHILHGVAPWTEGAEGPDAGRMTAYFRPEFPHIADWLSAP